MSLITKKYLSLSDANRYFLGKTGHGLGVGDLRQLEREGKVTPLVYLDVNFMHAKLPDGNLYSFDLTDNKFIKRVKGYFKSSNFILLDCYEPTPYEFADLLEFKSQGKEYLYFNEGRELFELIEEIPQNPHKIKGAGYIFNKSIKNEQGFYEDINTISTDSVLIQRSELDELINNYKKSDIQRIAELENELAQVTAQLDEQQQSPQRTRAQTDETNTDKKLIAMMALLLAKQSNTFRIGQKPNYKQINEAILNLATDLKIANEDMRGLQANADKISKAVQAHADMFKLSKD